MTRHGSQELAAQMRRPAGLAGIVLVHFLGAFLLVLIALLMFAIAGEARSGTTFNTDIAQGLKPFIQAFGVVVGLLFVCFSVVPVVLGIALWRLNNWARILALALAIFNLSICGSGGLVALFSGWGFLLLMLLISCAVNFWIVRYLLRPHVKQAFGAKSL